MISFIIIGRNEGWKLTKCFESIFESIEYNAINNFEVIYIDSDSTDNSIEIAKVNQANKIYKISGNINAAVARNVGASAAKGNILFFLDGDIKLYPFDISIIINKNKKLLYNYVVGFLDDVNYDSKWNFINQTPRHYKTEIKDKEVTIVGGAIFIIPRSTWVRFGGMDERLKRTQDRDLSLRMARKGILGIRKAEVFGLHHTIQYKDRTRMWEMLFNGSFNYSGVMIRKHLLNPSFFPKLIREEWTLIILIFSVVLIFVNPLYILFYLFAVIIRNKKQLSKRMIQYISHRVIKDIIVFFSILFFFPRRPKCKIVQINQF